ncbi:MAG: hypothetical protein ACM67P_00485 [Clostridiales bacterium]
MHRGDFRSARGAFFDSFFAGFGKFFFSLGARINIFCGVCRFAVF